MNPRLFLQIVSVEARKRMSYRADFWINAVLGFLVQLGVAWFLWDAIYAGGGGPIGGYTFRGMVLYYVAAILLGKFTRGTEFEQALSGEIYDGGLSRYLVYPAGLFRFKYAQQMGGLVPVALQVVLLGIWFPLFMDLPPEARITPASAAMAVPAVLAGNLLNFLAVLPIQSVAFWADNVWSLMVGWRIFSNLLGGMMFPIALFPGWAREALDWLPFRHLCSFPVETLLGRVGAGEWARGMALCGAWCVVFGLLARAVWRRGSLQYSGVGM